MARSSNGGGCLIWVIAIIAIIALPMVFGSSHSGGSSNTSTNNNTSATQTNNATQGNTSKPKDPDANLTPQSPPSNGSILDGSEGGYSGVQVNAAAGTSAYVKVKDMSGYTVVGFFVSPGSTAQIYVPEGTYDMQFAMGDTWYGKNHIFGNRTSFGQDKGVYLGYGDVITYSLQRTTSGNFSMQSLDASQF